MKAEKASKAKQKAYKKILEVTGLTVREIADFLRCNAVSLARVLSGKKKASRCFFANLDRWLGLDDSIILGDVGGVEKTLENYNAKSFKLGDFDDLKAFAFFLKKCNIWQDGARFSAPLEREAQHTGIPAMGEVVTLAEREAHHTGIPAMGEVVPLADILGVKKLPLPQPPSLTGPGDILDADTIDWENPNLYK